MFIYQVVFCLSRLFAAVGIVSPVSIPAIAPHSLHIRPFFYSVIPASEPGSWAALCEVLHPCHRHPRLRPPGFAYAPIGLRFGNPCKHGCAHLAPIVHIKCGMTVLSHRCTIVCAIVIPANASQGAGSAAGMTVLSPPLETLHATSLPCAVCAVGIVGDAARSVSTMRRWRPPARMLQSVG